MNITYAHEPDLDVDAFIAILKASGLAERRPIHDRRHMVAALLNAQLNVVARAETGQAIGVARSITDWASSLYCADLAVDKAFQGKGIGKALLMKTVDLAPRVRSFILVAAPGAVSFYEQAGYERLPDTFRFHFNAPT